MAKTSSRPRDKSRYYDSESAKLKEKMKRWKHEPSRYIKTRNLSEFFNAYSDGAESKEIETENTEIASHCTDDGNAI